MQEPNEYVLRAILLTSHRLLFSDSLIHEYYNVAPVPFRFDRDGNIPRTIEMPLLRRSEKRPTHALAILSSLAQPNGGSHTPAVPSQPTTPIHYPPSPSTPSLPFTPVQSEPYVLPIDASLFCAKFGHDVARSLAAGMLIKAAKPLVHRDRATGADLLTLPLIPLYVPHPPSIPHLLLYAQGLPLTSRRVRETPNYSRPTTLAIARAHPSPSTLATHLLPISVIEEFPAAPAMAETMARQCDDESLRDHVVFNQGLWRNVLLLAPTDASVVDLARTAWNVTAEARRLREQRRAALPFAHPPPSPRAEKGIPTVSVQYVDAPVGYRALDTIHLLPVPPRKLGHRRSQKNLRA
ncbi:hypothetical protein C8Q80DRAFT_1117993 [Daedaleopsis nitida]|nr:hypothetical protein C8Q80DRAFT_1117993 [Daedaleopsis nitida]